MAQVGLDKFADRLLDSLSGGQLQRVLSARVLVQDAPLILLDEPFGAFDDKTIRDLTARIGRWHAEGRTVLTVAHDLALVRAHFPQTLLLARHAVAWGPTAEVLTEANIARGHSFQEAWDETAPWGAPNGAWPRQVHAKDGDLRRGPGHPGSRHKISATLTSTCGAKPASARTSRRTTQKCQTAAALPLI